MASFEIVLEPRGGWAPIDLREIWRYRELLSILVWRDITVRYKQTLLGGTWAIIQPLVGMLIFGLLFARVASMRGDGSPYPLFVFAGLVPWTFFANAIGLASNSLLGSEQMIRKVYFPRILIPFGVILALILDMAISLAFMGGLLLYYRRPVTVNILLLPVFVIGSILAVSGLGLILAALNVRYRDVKYVVPFFTQMVFFLTPVLYPLSSVPAGLRPWMQLNPMAGMVEGFRATLLGSPISWPVVWMSVGASAGLFVAGLFYFRRLERNFADVI